MEDFRRIYENRRHRASGFGNWTSREDKNCGDYDSDGLSGFDSYEDNDFLHNLHYNLRRNLRHTKTFFKKTYSHGKPSKHYTSRVLYIPFYPPHSPILDTKAPKR